MTEIEKKIKIVDMMISMNSSLYNKYKNYVSFSNITLLICSITLNVIAFADFNYLEFLNIKEQELNYFIPYISFLIFIISIIIIICDWTKLRDKHLNAINQLSRLKNELKKYELGSNQINTGIQYSSISELYSQTFENTPKISERKFNILKSRHYRKVELSKFIDEHKGKHFIIILILFYCNRYFKK